MSLGNILPPWHQFLDQKICGAHFSLGIVAGERFAIELTPSTFPQRHCAGDMFPQRHVAGERVGMLLGKASNTMLGAIQPYLGVASLYCVCSHNRSEVNRGGVTMTINIHWDQVPICSHDVEEGCKAFIASVRF
ncbi:hypothetical protein Tco_0670606 [Tanacetum coccineum]